MNNQIVFRLCLLGALLSVIALAACQQQMAPPQTVEVVKEVEVTRIVEVPVTVPAQEAAATEEAMATEEAVAEEEAAAEEGAMAQEPRELTVLAGAGQDTVSINAFFPASLRIRAGDTVTWKINSDEPIPPPFSPAALHRLILFPFPMADQPISCSTPSPSFPAGRPTHRSKLTAASITGTPAFSLTGLWCRHLMLTHSPLIHQEHMNISA